MNPETPPKPKIDIEHGYEDFVPEEFRQDPFTYFESEKGENLKPWTEQAAKVKEFQWRNQNQETIQVVAKKVSFKLHQLGDPLHEYKIMEILNQIGLPAAVPVASVEANGNFMIVTERIPGIIESDFEQLLPELRSRGYTQEDIKRLKRQVEDKMKELKASFESAGIYKDYHKDHWKIKDMVIDLDIENKQIRGIVPTDWEKTQIDTEKLEAHKRKNRQ